MLYAVNPLSGHVYWSFKGALGDREVRGGPALSPDGKILYLGSGGGDLYALSAGPTGGQLDWTYHIQGPAQGDIQNDPAVGPDGTIYVATGGGSGSTHSDIEAVNPNGTRKWVYVSNGNFETTPAVTAAGQVVAGNDVGFGDPYLPTPQMRKAAPSTGLEHDGSRSYVGDRRPFYSLFVEQLRSEIDQSISLRWKPLWA